MTKIITEVYINGKWIRENSLAEEDYNTMKWSDQQRAQLLQIYKDKITQLGEEKFFDQFDQIREEAHRTVTGSTSAMGDLVIKQHSSSIPYYVDPIHTVQSAGRLGGLSKSDAKVKAVRENGRKGGRPKSSGQSLKTDLFK